MTSVLSPAHPALPCLPDLVLRHRLEAVREHLIELSRCAPPRLAYDFADLLGGIEDTLQKAGGSPRRSPTTIRPSSPRAGARHERASGSRLR